MLAYNSARMLVLMLADTKTSVSSTMSATMSPVIFFVVASATNVSDNVGAIVRFNADLKVRVWMHSDRCSAAQPQKFYVQFRDHRPLV